MNSLIRTRDGNGSSFVTRDPWPLHRFILRYTLGIGGVWHGGTGQPLVLKAKIVA